jgi:phosphate transport system substrate-binding protein
MNLPKNFTSSLVKGLLVASAALTFTGAKSANELRIKGSDTMVNLASAWAEAYMAKHSDVIISVDGGGSGTGIAALINKTVDIADASREIKQKEKESAAANYINPVETSVARDAISFIVNPSNSVKELTMDQLARIYTGEYTNWNQVGGPNQKITLCSRENTSGTYAFVQEFVMKNKNYAQTAMLLPSNASIVQEVSTNKWAIGYVGLGYLVEAGNKVRAVGVKKNSSSPAVLPSEENVKNGTYPVARFLYVYTPGQPSGLTRKYIDFCLSAEGQKIVVEAGFVTLK